MDRRTLLRRGLAGGVLLAVGGGGLALWPSTITYRPVRPLFVLDERTFGILAAVARRTVDVDGVDPVAIAHGVDETLSYGPEEGGTDFRRLLLLLDSPLAGLLLDGRARPFTALDPASQDAVLRAWRDSKLVLRRSGYVALRKLTQGAHYASPSTWASVGYPGPPEVPT